MTYNINRSDPFNTDAIVVPDTTTDGPVHPVKTNLSAKSVSAATSLLIHGRGNSSFGERLCENFIHLLESFAGASEPAYPIDGQLWLKRLDYVNANGNWYAWSRKNSTWSAITVASSAPQNLSNNSYYLNNGDLYRYINKSDVKVSPTAFKVEYSERGFNEPNAAEYLPEVELLVYKNGTWVGASDVDIGKFEPTGKSGKLWFDSEENTLKLYKDGSFQNVVGDFLALTGGALSGDLIMGTNYIKDLAEPVDDGDATTKSYVDSLVDGVAPANNNLDALQDVSYAIAAPSASRPFLRWDDGATAWGAGTISVEDIVDLSVAGITITELDKLSNLDINIKTKFTSLDSDISDKLPLAGGEMSGSILMAGSAVKDLPPEPADDTDASSKFYVDKKTEDLKRLFVQGENTTGLFVPSGSPFTLVNYDSSEDELGIFDLTDGLIRLSTAQVIGFNPITQSNASTIVNISVFVRWSAPIIDAGTRTITIGGVPIYSVIEDSKNRILTQTFSTGPINLAGTEDISVIAEQDSGDDIYIEFCSINIDFVRNYY